MSNLIRGAGLSLLLLLALGSQTLADDVRELTWDDLIPASKQDKPLVAPESANRQELVDEGGWDDDWEDDSFEQMFQMPAHPMGVVEELDGIQAKLPGFIVPLDLAEEGKVKEFLLVPYFGACIHYPPPPPNQVVYVTLEEPIEVESMWAPIWAYGEFKTKSFDSGLGSAEYTMVATAIEEYEY